MSNLPKIDYPIYSVKIPSLKKEHKFRPFLVKEEKLLLMARESENTTDILTAIKQVVGNCSLDKTLNIDKLAVFDLEYLFLKLRSFSVDNTIKVSYKDNEDDKVYDFEINLEEVKVVYPPKTSNNIKITEDTGIIMKYPSAALYDDKDFMSLDKDYMFELILRCIESIYVGEEIFDAKSYKKQDLSEFLENLNIKVFQEVQKFLINVPKMEYVIEYENSLGHKREIVLNSLNDFFTWR